MSPEYWHQIAPLFEAALHHAPAERRAFLDQACADDPELRRDVEDLLDAAEDADAYFDELAHRAGVPAFADVVPAVQPAPEPSFEGHRFVSAGFYRIVREVGRGGMGTVYLAHRTDAEGHLEQRIALKVIKRGMDTDLVLQRFLRERQILARLQHPNIARFYDAGLTDDGRPYVAMEYVDGIPLTDYCDARRLGVEDRLRLFQAVCEAVHYAHRNLVVHRDLKPSNIMVTTEGRVKLLDFGIAKLLGGEGEPVETLTETGMRVMTPAYAAPEQVRSEPVTTATDVYALGIVLYELLTGRRPYRFVGWTPVQIAQVVAGEQPERPSTVVGRVEEITRYDGTPKTITPELVGQARNTQVDRLRRRLSGDLDTICLMALRKEPEHRYASVEAFVEDIKRHLDGRPVTARKGTWSYRAKTFVRRHRWGVAAATGFVLLLATFIGAYTQGVQQESRAAQREAGRANLMAGVMQDLLEAGDPYAWGAQRGDSLFLVLGQQKVTTDLAGEPDLQVKLLTTLGRVYRRRGQYDQARMHLERALAIARATYAAPHLSTITALKELGYYYSDLGAYAQAEPFYHEVIMMQRHIFGEGHPEVSTGLTTMAQLKMLEGHEAEAEAMLRQVVALTRAASADSAYLTSTWKLARVLCIRGKFAEAEQQFRDILARRRQQFGEPHREVARTMQWLGLVLTDKGNFTASEAYLRQALAMQREVLGEEHQDVAVSLFGLGLLAKEQGHYPEAVAWLEKSIAMTRQVLGEDHVDTAFHMQILGEVYRLMGRYEQAQAILRDALRINRQVLGTEHERVGSLLVSLGKTLNDAGELAAAQAAFEEALGMLQREGLSRQRSRLEALAGYGAVLTRMGHAEDAEPLLREAVSLLTEKIVAPHHRYVVYARAALGHCLAAQHRYAEAEPLLLTVFTTYHDHYGPSDPRTQTARADLADLYTAWGKPGEADSYAMP